MATSSKQHAPSRLFVTPARSFVDSMTSARAATDVLRLKAQTPSQVESDFVAEAEYMYPQYSTADHVQAAKLVHKAVHHFQDARNALKEQSETEIESVYQSTFGPVQTRLEEITGDPEAEHHYRHVWNRISSRPSTERLLGAALLTQAVSEFEVLVGRLVRGVLESNPDILLGSDQKFSVRDLQQFATFEELRESLSRDFADRVLRKGFLAWMEWFQSQLKVDLPGVFSNSGEITEVFQRRHLLVHNGGVVNDSYLANVKGIPDPPDEGTKLRVSRPYLSRAIDLLEASGVKLAAAAAFKFATDESERTAVEEMLDHVCFDALQHKRWVVASTVSEWLIPRVQDDPARMRLRVNNWLARKALDGMESVEAEVQRWDTRSLQDQYKLAKLALLDDLQAALELATGMLESNALSEVQWRAWPLLAGVREHAREVGASLPVSEPWSTSHAD